MFVSGQLGDVKLEDLPGPEALLRPGTKYGVQHSSNLETKNTPNADLNTNEESNQKASEAILGGQPQYMRIPSRKSWQMNAPNLVVFT